jgi:antitoxin (DNA-binding transcriptional repressor) of toxin-antitoxin stability system
MRTYTVGEFKTHFSAILEVVQSGERVAITFGKKRKIVAYLVPPSMGSGKKRPLGLLAGKGKVSFADDIKITEEEFCRSSGTTSL